MFRKILDVTHVDMADPLTVDELEINLRRLERLDHPLRPASANICKITARHDSYRPGSYTNFVFDVQ